MAKWEKERGCEVGLASGEGELMGCSCNWRGECELGLAGKERKSSSSQRETSSCWAATWVCCLGLIWVEIGLKNGLNIGLKIGL